MQLVCVLISSSLWSINYKWSLIQGLYQWQDYICIYLVKSIKRIRRGNTLQSKNIVLASVLKIKLADKKENRLDVQNSQPANATLATSIVRTISMKPIPMLPYHRPQNQQYKTSDDATVTYHHPQNHQHKTSVDATLSPSSEQCL